MKLLFITRLYLPHIGGVEKHIYNVTRVLKTESEYITVLTGKHGRSLKDNYIGSRTKIVQFFYPHIKLLGIIFVWWQFFRNIKLIKEADIVHCHDVFIWYLPFRFIYPNKKVITTIHGFEWDSPLLRISLWQKRLAVKLSAKTIGVGEFLEKYLKVKFDLITYGAATPQVGTFKKQKNTIAYVGRLEENTGLLQFLNWIKINSKYKVDFCGDGPLRKECEKYGEVHGFTNPAPYYRKAEYCVPGGYLAALEGLSYNCKLKLFWNNKIKEDYWKMSPFYKLKGEELKKWAKKQTWEKLANEYLDLYNSIK